MKNLMIISMFGCLGLFWCLGCETEKKGLDDGLDSDSGADTDTDTDLNLDTDTLSDSDARTDTGTDTGTDPDSDTLTSEDTDTGYNGSGKLLPVSDALLGSCDTDEQNALKSSGFTRTYYGSIGNWTKIFTIQGSPQVSQDLVDEVGAEVKRALQPIVERYPDRLRESLDHSGGTMNFILIYGSGGGWGAWYDGQGTIFAKRLSARDLDVFHEIGHHFDINNPTSSFRSHIGSILSADDANTIDDYCSYTKPDGTCAYSEFIAENYGKMFYPNFRESVKTDFPVVYERLLKYVPTPSSYVPFLN